MIPPGHHPLLYPVAGFWKKVNVYDVIYRVEFLEGRFYYGGEDYPLSCSTPCRHRSVPRFRSDGYGDLKHFVWSVEQWGLNADFVVFLPTAIMKPLSGSGARGMMLEAMKNYIPILFVGRLSCIFQCSTDTTFYTGSIFRKRKCQEYPPCRGLWLACRFF